MHKYTITNLYSPAISSLAFPLLLPPAIRLDGFSFTVVGDPLRLPHDTTVDLGVAARRAGRLLLFAIDATFFARLDDLPAPNRPPSISMKDVRELGW